MRLQFIYTLLFGTAIAIPYGGQEYRQDMKQPTTLTTPIPMSAFAPIKRAIEIARTPSRMDAQKRMLPYEYEFL
ncbi:uncharacterized protein PGRI_003830 [Penicillium griseofulvum]|uniref:Uncharacterized protein n=1 Tax=Penicillium patulum TaxID=5078 RepID=A0A135LWJ0_PENPA|nr:uncharacterized protein PGRI_003830 [Penicillium griseofulvum]KXG53333.1 hypothetical protein PGRI_003830 [Penicillium griseofulvum]